MKDNEFKQTWDGNFKNFNLSEKEIGYLAGFLDADGSISISIRKNTEGYFF